MKKLILKNAKSNNNADKIKDKDSHIHSHDTEEGLLILQLLLGSILFVLAITLKLNFSSKQILFLSSYIIVGFDVVITATKNIVKGNVFSEHFLMSIATIGAFFIGEYAEAVAVMFFYLMGELLQEKAIESSRNSIKSLLSLKSDYANLITKAGVKKLKPEDVNVGDTIMVKLGEKVPLDGVIVKGESLVDTKAMTGESIPKKVKVGSEVLSGYINTSGLIQVKVQKEYKDSAVSKIIELVENASNKKAESEKFISKFSKYYTPVVVFLAFLIAIIPIVFLGESFSKWIYRALIFLVISCPCALVISIPVSFIGGIGGASKNGILVKGGNYLEALTQVDTVVFDKTGTLTKGVFEISAINEYAEVSKKEILEIAATIESNSNHPIADSIKKAYKDIIDFDRIKTYEEISGRGIKANIDGENYILGNSSLMEEYDIAYRNGNTFETVIHLAKERKYIGNIVISDKIKTDSKQAINKLKNIGIKNISMLSGDKKEVALNIGEQIGLDKVYYELMPMDKVNKLEEIIESKDNKQKKVLFVGDGINDAAVLSRADIGVAMGGVGSDIAIEASDIVLMTDEPSKIAEVINLAKKTRNIAMQNIIFALIVKIIFLTIGALGFVNMWEAVFADVGVTILAIINAMRTLK